MMKSKSRVVILGFLLSVISFAITAPAAEKIEGAFGLRLGDSFVPSGNHFLVEHRTYVDAFEFTPKIPNPAFSTYVVFITTNTHRIYSILAISKPLDPAFGAEQSKIISALLHRKYGRGPFGQYGENNPLELSQQGRKIVVSNLSSGPGDFKFQVIYTDEMLAIQAAEERLDNKLKGANADGL